MVMPGREIQLAAWQPGGVWICVNVRCFKNTLERLGVRRL